MHFAKKEGLGSIPKAAGGIARLACARLSELGKDPAPVLAKAGITAEQLSNRAIWLEVRAQIRLLELAAAELQDDLLGFHLARSFDLREIGLLYYVMASSEQLDDALQGAERYSRILNEGIRLRFSLQDRAATIALDYVNVDRKADRHQVEFWLVALVRICRQVTDTRLAPSQLKMRHVRSETPEEFRTFFGCDVEYGADADAVSFPDSLPNFPLPAATNTSTNWCGNTRRRRSRENPATGRCFVRRWRKCSRVCCRMARPWHRKCRGDWG